MPFLKHAVRLGLLLCVTGLLTLPVFAQESPPVTTWVPMGGGYSDTFDGFLQAALANVTRFNSSRLYVLAMPMSYSANADSLTPNDLIVNTLDSELRRRQLEDECRIIVPAGLSCEVLVPPIYTRTAAQAPNVVDYFESDLAGVYFLGGDQDVAMQITAGTPLETALADAFARGVVMGGTSAGLALESRTMIGGYGGDAFGPENAFLEGAVDLWQNKPDGRRGLDFGITSAILDAHFFERARLPRLLNALVHDRTPGIGIGIDTYTAVHILDDSRLTAPFGLYAGVILDIDTLGARATATFDTPAHTLSVRNVVFHTFAPGDFSYDFTTHATSITAAPEPAARDFSALVPPDSAGTLMLVGNLSDHPELLPDYLLSSHGIALIIGETDPQQIARITDRYAGQSMDVVALAPGDPLPELSGYDTVIVYASDVTTVMADSLRAPLYDAWMSGKTLVLSDAAAVLIGQQYVKMPPNDAVYDAAFEAATEGALLDGTVTFGDGLNFLPITVETRVMADNRWARFIALAYHDPSALAVALPDDGAITLAGEGVFVSGTNSVTLLDLRTAALALGTNNGYIVANGLMDVFAPGDALVPATR